MDIHKYIRLVYLCVHDAEVLPPLGWGLGSYSGIVFDAPNLSASQILLSNYTNGQT